MSNLHYFAAGPVADAMADEWGGSLQALNLNEKLWLLRNGLALYIDWEQANIEDDCGRVAAEDALLYLSDDFVLKVVYGFSKYLVDEPNPLSYYLSSTAKDENEWVENAMETWGSHLEALSENPGLVFIFNTATGLIDFDDLPHLQRLHECLEMFKQVEDDEQLFKIFSALPDLALTQALAEAR